MKNLLNITSAITLNAPIITLTIPLIIVFIVSELISKVNNE